MGCCRSWGDRSLSFPPTFWCWSTVRLWFGRGLSFAPCFRSSTPLNLSSSSTARRWLDHRGDRISRSTPCFVSCRFHVSIAVVSPSDHPLLQLPTGAENLSFHHLHLLLPGGAPVWLGSGHCCNGLQCRCVSIFFFFLLLKLNYKNAL